MATSETRRGARHLHVDGRRTRVTRNAIVAVVWLAGLFAGFYALLSVAVRYGCSANDTGLACHTGGSAVGVLLVVAVISVVTAVTVLALTRSPRATAVLAVGGVVALALCYAGARLLLHTV